MGSLGKAGQASKACLRWLESKNTVWGFIMVKGKGWDAVPHTGRDFLFEFLTYTKEGRTQALSVCPAVG